MTLHDTNYNSSWLFSNELNNFITFTFLLNVKPFTENVLAKELILILQGKYLRY
jgi:hypothetical protein